MYIWCFKTIKACIDQKIYYLLIVCDTCKIAHAITTVAETVGFLNLIGPQPVAPLRTWKLKNAVYFFKN